MQTDEVVRELARLRRRVERLEAQDPPAGPARRDPAGNVTVRLGDAAGATAWIVADVGETPVARIDSDGHLAVAAGAGVYWGDPAAEGTWRLVRAGDDLLLQHREAGTYVTRQTWTPV